MLIGVDIDNRIRQIDSNIYGEVVAYVEIDRRQTFGNMSDLRILNYCYKQYETGCSVYPSRALSEIDMLEKENEILNLQAQVIELEFEKRLQGVM